MKWLAGALILATGAFLACDQPFAPETAIVQGMLDTYYFYYDPPPSVASADGALVRLFANPEFTGTPVAVVTARRNVGDSVAFRFDGVPPGTYYVQAWKDLDSNGVVSSGDLYGIYLGNMWGDPRPLQAWPGDPAPLHVVRGTVYRIGIWMEPYPLAPGDLVITASGGRSADRTQTAFYYQVNVTSAFDSTRVRLPSGSSVLLVRSIRLEPGQLDSIGLSAAPGDTMPTGEYVLTFWGMTGLDGPTEPAAFTKDVRVSVP